MLVSSLPDVPGHTFEIRGLVFADCFPGSIGGGNLPTMIQTIIEQANGFRANAIIDVKLTTSERILCVMGTAVVVTRIQG
ncbi:hypothetical protein Lfu02_45310 [Longispora fulva]|uniref:Uncharacterized protein n=1 Tax=Longispora fulva TaxID=619741 RepID=A0A8J7GH77_9ACTN|nr:hypothetical protein [Longispora fulva]MBG6137906.1 hypothetical protein [Longispora fulva]GIG60159.1 hypothetical protein Lfu02_45310 [Longispora fulva]